MSAKSRQTSETPFDFDSEADDLEGLDIPDDRTGQGAIGNSGLSSALTIELLTCL